MIDQSSAQSKRLPKSVLTTSAGALAAALLPMPGADGRILHIPATCPFYQMTGLPCPFCGMTRSVICLAHGRLAESLHYHPLGIVFALAAAVIWVDGMLCWRTGAGLPRLSLPARNRLTALTVAVIVAVAVVRDVLVATHRFVL
jgi:hypothetical protein